MKTIDAKTLRTWIEDSGELALLDAREDGEFGAEHLFWAVPCGMSRRETRARALLPRLDTRICVTDDGRGVAQQLAAWLESIGCTDVSVLDGGTKAWAAAGYVVFSGMNVPSKAFGEWVEHHYGTESLDAAELDALIKSGTNMVVLDSRTQEEFNRMSIPTGVSVPGGELVYRIGDIAPDPETLVVVNCAGRTRSIMGAESLRRAGIPNKVVALRNGTMGWDLAGLTCDRGKTARFAPGTPKTAELALQRATAFAHETGVRTITPAQLAAFEADSSRTLYVLDVRDPPEYRAGHRAGSINAPGGQLVQATDTWVGVRGARTVLLCDTGARARMSAAWLRLMGHQDVFVADGALHGGTARAAVPELGIAVSTIDVSGLAAILSEATVIDLARSVDFRDGHIPGAIWGVRSRLGPIPTAQHIVIASPDGEAAVLAVPEVRALTGKEPRVLAGGTAAWKAAGQPLEKNRLIPADEDCIDFYLRPYDRNSGIEEAMNAYLSWEIDLVHEIDRDGTVKFGTGH